MKNRIPTEVSNFIPYFTAQWKIKTENICATKISWLVHIRTEFWLHCFENQENSKHFKRYILYRDRVIFIWKFYDCFKRSVYLSTA
jgi:hypothetical protein